MHAFTLLPTCCLSSNDIGMHDKTNLKSNSDFVNEVQIVERMNLTSPAIIDIDVANSNSFLFSVILLMLVVEMQSSAIGVY